MTERLSVSIFDENYKYIIDRVNEAAIASGRKPEDITILAATKTVDVETINYAIGQGIRYIGENKVQELNSKYDYYAPVHKHFIGHLQTNKVKDIIEKVELIQSVDSVKLANEIQKQAEKKNINIDVLLEVNIGNEESKSGFCADELLEAVYGISQFDRIRIKGLMAIPPVCENELQNRKYFEKMNKLYIDIQSKKIDNSNMDILSMGMSDDYSMAIKEGATLVRIGTALFGKRNYNI